MTLDWKLTRIPLPFSADRGAESVIKVGGLSKDTAALVSGAGGSSPYLGGLIERFPDFTRDLLITDPEIVMADLLHETRTLSPDKLQSGLRVIKGKVALVAALADLGGVWALEDVTGALTKFADAATDVSIRSMVAREAKRGKLPGVSEEEALETAGGLAVIAMGKMGAGELNYSSDIDLICLFDEARYERDDYNEARAALIRATKGMAKLLSELTGDGYVFRTDLRLRPDPSVTPVCMAMEAAERYYESLGRTWERAAYIKSRACAGNISAGEDFLKRMTPFVWRRHLDFAAIEDAHDMRLRIREHKGVGGAINLDGHDMKLGRGGIREIEFFTQTRQIISGGRDPKLRERGTVAGLAALAAGKWIEADLATQLQDDYREHREVEHRLQMVADAQTHALPSNEEGFSRLAHLMGRDDVTTLKSELAERLHRVHAATEPFFAPDEAAPAQNIEAHSDTIARWTRLPALRSERAQKRFQRLSPMVFERLEAAAHPAEAISAFENFLSGLPAGVQLFALFEANPHLVDLIIDIVGTAPALSDYLGRNSGVLDAVIGGSFFAEWPGADALETELSAELANASDYEAKLDAARRFMKERHFRIGVHHLRGLVDATVAGAQYAEIALSVVRSLWPVVGAEFASKHGTPPGRGACVLGMGSLGSGRLNAGSDLDLIVIYDDGGIEASDGRRPLPSRTYFARLTQALVTALSAPMTDGRLYEVDMRLRPSGRQGPVATALSSFRSYQLEEAWGWEHFALTRARTLTGDNRLCDEVEAFRQELLDEAHDEAKTIVDVAQMREKLNQAHPRRSVWDVKFGPGGVRDIELLAQSATLIAGSQSRNLGIQIEAAKTIGWISEVEVQTLQRAEDLMWDVLAAERLLIDGSFDFDAVGLGGQAFLVAGASQSGIDALAKSLETSYQAVAEIFERLFSVGTEKL